MMELEKDLEDRAVVMVVQVVWNKQINKASEIGGTIQKYTCYKTHSSQDCHIFVGNYDKCNVVQYESVPCTTEVS